MKRIINVLKISLIFLVILFICNNVYATSITLEQIVEKFNKSSIVDDYKNAGGSISATNDVNSINVEVNASGKTENVELLLEGNVLSIEIDQGDESAFVKAYVASSVIDIIGQLHGYKEGELSQTINSDKATNYTLEKEGYEVENISATKFKIKVDITKKIPLVDFSSTYIEVSDLQDLKEYISGDGFAEKRKGDIWFNKSGYDGENTLLIAEKDNLTDNTYKSILSIIEVMFDSSKVSDYFKTNYYGISAGNKEFEGFKVEINPTKTEFEERLIPSDSGYKFARITINKSLVNSAIDGINKNTGSKEEDKKIDNSSNTNKESNSPTKEQDNTLPSGKLPRTGLNMTLPIERVIVITLIAVVFYKKYNSYKDIK